MPLFFIQNLAAISMSTYVPSLQFDPRFGEGRRRPPSSSGPVPQHDFNRQDTDFIIRMLYKSCYKVLILFVVVVGCLWQPTLNDYEWMSYPVIYYKPLYTDPKGIHLNKLTISANLNRIMKPNGSKHYHIVHSHHLNKKGCQIPWLVRRILAFFSDRPTPICM